ncbi:MULTISPECIES: gp436 family protein [unclassified Bradyrhizobium]|uniref:gp436 family protein n=1 Tax=unclassified Bradyrhizobium TaxID=2631580 RepID=UPI00211DA7B3|nr:MULTISPECIES: DUF1320 domain-containing protein [unclassified Bradyrhizobium]MDD1534565.1 DUF1320 domain-containing protein [Bradyrhizobium sp. WBOS8]MDD1581429.1 DUF1320 domain-containing protein [Bradyrhizobium sp. WBOS4]UUO49718.1 DUF1320 domain-containing protein [Bradyrhizobium sp. WBOS04]UUO58483.1 DUF1320 domain-containing protein [Bradyrhizobium sp. WBOS08]
MTYATQAELVERFGETMLIDLTDRVDPPAGAIDSGVVTDALADTDAMIDGYLLNRYQLPLATTPALLNDLAKAIAIYKLHRDSVSDKIRADYQDALKTLKQIADGVVRLNVAGVEPASSGATGVRVTDRPRDFTPDNLKGFI